MHLWATWGRRRTRAYQIQKRPSQWKGANSPLGGGAKYDLPLQGNFTRNLKISNVSDLLYFPAYNLVKNQYGGQN